MRGRTPLAALLGLAVCLVALLFAVRCVAGCWPAYRETMLNATFESTGGLDLVGREAALRRVLDYSLGRTAEMQLVMPAGSLRPGEAAFTARELAHMADVRGLFALGRLVQWLGLAVLLAAWGIWRRCGWAPLASAVMGWAVGWAVAGSAIIAAAAAIDFGWAFEQFHGLLFTNDLWLLEPSSLLLSLLPGWQFARLGALIAVAWLGLLGLSLVAVRYPAYSRSGRFHGGVDRMTV